MNKKGDIVKQKRKVKAGRLTHAEEDYIYANQDKLVPAEIAERLGRSEKQILIQLSKVRDNPRLRELPEQQKFRHNLKESAMWKNLKDELEPEELQFFEEQYIMMMNQFTQGDDSVLATEENQIFKVIKLDILKHRNALRQRRIKRDVERSEKAYDIILKTKPYTELTDVEREHLSSLEGNIQNLYAQQSALATEYVKLEDKHQKLMEALKATREQRVDKIENGNVSFLGVLRTLGKETFRDENERYIEVMRRATSNEIKRLSEPRQFSDGAIDQPLLTPDNLNTEPIN